jgi:hypothetical protein
MSFQTSNFGGGGDGEIAEFGRNFRQGIASYRGKESLQVTISLFPFL